LTKTTRSTSRPRAFVQSARGKASNTTTTPALENLRRFGAVSLTRGSLNPIGADWQSSGWCQQSAHHPARRTVPRYRAHDRSRPNHGPAPIVDAAWPHNPTAPPLDACRVSSGRRTGSLDHAVPLGRLDTSSVMSLLFTFPFCCPCRWGAQTRSTRRGFLSRSKPRGGRFVRPADKSSLSGVDRFRCRAPPGR
jgi:hypothetical protein